MKRRNYMKKLKVFGGIDFYEAKQERMICAAYTKKQAVELLNSATGLTTMGYFNSFWCETGNEKELSIATEIGVWIVPRHDDREVKRIK
jgi:hypothetical protein